MDIDGTSTYSSMVAIEVEAARGGEFTVYPNPIVDAFTVRLPANSNESFTLTLVDLSGKAVFARQVQSQSGLIPVNLDRKPAPGIYLVCLRSASRQLVTKVLVK